MKIIQSNMLRNAEIMVLGILSLSIIIKIFTAEQTHYITLLVVSGVMSMCMGMMLLLIYSHFSNKGKLRVELQSSEPNDKYYEAVCDLNRISGSVDLTEDEQITEILSIGCKYLKMYAGRISYVNLALHSSTVTKTIYSDIYKEKVNSSSIADSTENNSVVKMETFLSAPIAISREFYGTVSFQCDSRENRSISYEERNLVNFIGSAIGSVLEREVTQMAFEVMNESGMDSQLRNSIVKSIGNELQSPVAQILSYSDLLIEDAEKQGNKNSANELKKIKNASSQMMALVNDIMHISRLESEPENLILKKISVELAIKEAVKNLKHELDDRNNILDIRFITNLGYLKTDEEKFCRVISSLISNACKITSGGVIQVRADREVDQYEEWVVINIINSGVGIERAEMQNLLGETTSQSNSKLPSNSTENGLGLYISREYCRQMGGELRVENKPGIGSIFTLRLPYVLRETDSILDNFLKVG